MLMIFSVINHVTISDEHFQDILTKLSSPEACNHLLKESTCPKCKSTWHDDARSGNDLEAEVQPE